MRRVLFISYRRSDSAGYVGRLQDGLKRRGWSVKRDIHDVQPGAPFEESLGRLVHEVTAVLVVIGPGWLDATDREGRRRLDQPGDFVRLEIEAALQDSSKRVIPILVHGASMPSGDELPPDLRPLASRQAVELRDASWEFDLGRLTGFLGKQEGFALAGARRVAIVAIIGGVSGFLLWKTFVTPPAARVPSVIGLDSAHAHAMLEDVNLSLGAVEYLDTLGVLTGQVVHQDPAPGEVANATSTVDVTVARSNRVETPNLMTSNVDSARAILDELGLEAVVSERPMLDLPVGEVIEQDPLPGSYLEPEAVVNIVVATSFPPGVYLRRNLEAGIALTTNILVEVRGTIGGSNVTSADAILGSCLTEGRQRGYKLTFSDIEAC